MKINPEAVCFTDKREIKLLNFLIWDILNVVFNITGLAFDAWDIDYYTELFRTKVQQNPTTVELFDLAQSNSEHSRHWFFKVRAEKA